MQKPIRKIACSGSHMGGKTTLARLLGGVFHLPAITYSKPTAAAKRLGYDKASDVLDSDMLLFQWLGLIEQVSAEKAALEEFEGYISDRSVVDYLAYYTKQAEHLTDSNSNKAYFDCVRAYAKDYDLIVIVPPLEQTPTNNGMRHITDPQEIHTSLLYCFEKLQITTKLFTVTADNPYDRVEEILNFLEVNNYNIKKPKYRFYELRKAKCQTF